MLREEGVTFQRLKTWKASNDPRYAAKKARVEHLYAIADHEPVASLTISRSMLTNTEAASVISEGMTRYQAQIAQNHPRRRREPAGRAHQRHHPRRHSLPASH